LIALEPKKEKVMLHSFQNSFLAAFGAVATAALFIGASVMPAFNNASALLI
tara:strand:+ start:721 stop:873 length:153 start_codon:yes stop_codon:yes gene_type:complete